MKTISIVTPCFNEEENIQELYRRIRETMADGKYAYEHIFIDNASTDHTVDQLREITKADPHVKVIINTRNFAHILSPSYVLLQASGDSPILLTSSLQTPPY